MSMRIYKSRKHDSARAIDLGNLLAIFLKPGIVQGIFDGANRNNLAACAENSRILKNVQFAK